VICHVGECFDEGVGVVGLVANQSHRIEILKQRLCTDEIAGLSWRKHQLHGIAQRIDERVNFSAQSTARAADRLVAVFLRAPALCWRARTIVVSIIRYSLPRSLANSLKIRSKTPLFAHRLKR
jgi:hypothetical protein